MRAHAFSPLVLLCSVPWVAGNPFAFFFGDKVPANNGNNNQVYAWETNPLYASESPYPGDGVMQFSMGPDVPFQGGVAFKVTSSADEISLDATSDLFSESPSPVQKITETTTVYITVLPTPGVESDLDESASTTSTSTVGGAPVPGGVPGGSAAGNNTAGNNIIVAPIINVNMSVGDDGKLVPVPTTVLTTITTANSASSASSAPTPTVTSTSIETVTSTSTNVHVITMDAGGGGQVVDGSGQVVVGGGQVVGGQVVAPPVKVVLVTTVLAEVVDIVQVVGQGYTSTIRVDVNHFNGHVDHPTPIPVPQLPPMPQLPQQPPQLPPIVNPFQKNNFFVANGGQVNGAVNLPQQPPFPQPPFPQQAAIQPPGPQLAVMPPIIM
ncbi:hypothetical protein IWQ57_005629 [Coemansia nantahalensis]|uniref:Uncharacterized protein n=1 Tax=Coemansia nantahalensis TaxID=2789366 RepID=A0ACC1JME4_9FUNG|nr:hypothetical protein IWQ57_005629 [Coemansia nantahalensis]